MTKKVCFVTGVSRFVVGGLLPGGQGSLVTRFSGLVVIPVMLGAISITNIQWFSYLHDVLRFVRP